MIIKKLTKEEFKELKPALQKVTSSGGYHKDQVDHLHHVFVAFDKKTVAALAGITCYHGHYVLRLCIVAKKYRGQGLQKALIRKRIAFLKQRKAEWVNVWVSPNNIYSFNNVIDEGFRLVKQKSLKIRGIEYVKLRKILR